MKRVVLGHATTCKLTEMGFFFVYGDAMVCQWYWVMLNLSPQFIESVDLYDRG